MFNPGTGNRLYIAGLFTSFAGVAAESIVSFDGTSLAPLGAGFPNQASYIPYIEDLQVYDPGTGPALYACGAFSSAGGVPANSIARWNGTAWSALGSGTDPESTVSASGTPPRGPGSWRAASSTRPAGSSTGGVALFDGNAWSSVNALGRRRRVVGTFNPGGGEQLYTVGVILPPPNPNGGGRGRAGPTHPSSRRARDRVDAPRPARGSSDSAFSHSRLTTTVPACRSTPRAPSSRREATTRRTRAGTAPPGRRWD